MTADTPPVAGVIVGVLGDPGSTFGPGTPRR
jgi:hypothetical protein